ncbi:hypothetical protein LLG95_04430 [bacterium]|nr:hypothetical protein [bacterium]
MRNLLLAFVCLAFIGSTVHAANIDVGAGASIQTAINGASDGDTITLTSSTVYKGNLRINKSIKLVAAAGQTPKVEQLDNTTTAPVILGVTASPSSVQLGSATGGRLTFQYLKWGIATGATLPSGMIRIDSTTGSTVLIENCDIISTGPDTYGFCSGIVHGANPATVTVKNTNINLNRANYTAGGDSGSRCYAYGIEIGDTHAVTYMTRRIPGPVYNLDHVRIKNYLRAGIWLQYTSATLNASYIDVGTVGEACNAGTVMPWGPLISFHQASTWTGRIDHSIFQGPANYHGFGAIGPNGTSITMTRSVVLGKATSASYGAIYAAEPNSAVGNTSSKCRLTMDHCDIASLGADGGAILKNAAGANNSLLVNITNSNLYSASANAVNLTLAAGESFTSNYNDVFGATANVGYTFGVHDLLLNPNYIDVNAADMRYDNNALKVGDSTGGAIGTNGGYGDVVTGIVPGFGVVNRAHGWTVLE